MGPTVDPTALGRLKGELTFTPALSELAQLLAVGSSETRLRIVYALGQQGELCVCDLAEILGISVSATSQHLTKARMMGLLTSRRDQQTIYYALSSHPFLRALGSLVAAAVDGNGGSP